MGRISPPHLLISEDLRYRSLRLEIGVDGQAHAVELNHRLEIVVAEAGLWHDWGVLTALAAQFVKLQSPNR